METITITKRTIKGKPVYNKRFDQYDNGFWGRKISKKEYNESKNHPVFMDFSHKQGNHILNIDERICYEN